MICISISDLAQLIPVIDGRAELIELRLDLIRMHILRNFFQRFRQV